MRNMKSFIKSAIFKPVLGAALLAAGFGLAMPASASESAAEAKQISWSFAGLFGTYDESQLQRGFQVFKEVCAGCHGAKLISFRNLAEEGGPGYSEDQVKALAATYTIADADAPDGERPGTPADRWPSPFTDQEAVDSFGIVPPDFSVLAKARSIHMGFPFWVFNYFTGYQEGGPDYIYNLLTSYEESPHGVEVPDGKYYYGYPGAALAMPPPLSDGLVDYQGSAPETVKQYAEDVSAFMMWMADPHLVARKEIGFRVLIFLFLFAGFMYLVKRKLFSNVAH